MTRKVAAPRFGSFDEVAEAARKGDAMAQERMGLMYLEGFGVAPDPAQARLWYERAADQDDPGGHFGMAMLYVSGLTMARDPVEAYKHLLLMERRKELLGGRWQPAVLRQMLAARAALQAKLPEPDRDAARKRAELWLSRLSR